MGGSYYITIKPKTKVSIPKKCAKSVKPNYPVCNSCSMHLDMKLGSIESLQALFQNTSLTIKMMSDTSLHSHFATSKK